MGLTAPHSPGLVVPPPLCPLPPPSPVFSPAPQGIEELCSKRDELSRQIQQEEEEKTRLQHDVRVLTEKLSRVNESLARRLTARADFDRTIAETEAAYMKVGTLASLQEHKLIHWWCIILPTSLADTHRRMLVGTHTHRTGCYLCSRLHTSLQLTVNPLQAALIKDNSSYDLPACRVTFTFVLHSIGTRFHATYTWRIQEVQQEIQESELAVTAVTLLCSADP